MPRPRSSLARPGRVTDTTQPRRAARRAALVDLRVRRHVEELQHARDRRGVEAAQRLDRGLADLAEKRPADVDRDDALLDLRDRARARIGRPDERTRGAERGAGAEPGGQRANHPALERGTFSNVHVGGVLAGAGRDQVVGVPLGAQEAEDGGQRREPDGPFAQAGDVEPVLVELETGRQQVRNRLVEAGDEDTADSRFTHDRPASGTFQRGTGHLRSDPRRRPRAAARRRRQGAADRRRRAHHRSTARRPRRGGRRHPDCRQRSRSGTPGWVCA